MHKASQPQPNRTPLLGQGGEFRAPKNLVRKTKKMKILLHKLPIILILYFAVAFSLVSVAAHAQAPTTAKAASPTDFTGYWVSVVTEDWLYRMVTPAKGDYSSVPINPEGRKVADAWDPARDEAEGNQCKAYGAPGIMRVPGRLQITWQDDNTLKIETDSGRQTRLLHFGASSTGQGGDWQGVSVAEWEVV